MKLIKTQIIVTISLAYLAASLVAYPGLMVCEDYDGYTKIETALNLCCDGFDDSKLSRHLNSTRSRDFLTNSKQHCDQCIDVPVSNSAILANANSVKTHPVKEFASIIAGTDSFSMAGIYTTHSIPIPLADVTLAQLRTVVLLN
jgi:hypothetical protein